MEQGEKKVRACHMEKRSVPAYGADWHEPESVHATRKDWGRTRGKFQIGGDLVLTGGQSPILSVS